MDVDIKAGEPLRIETTDESGPITGSGSFIAYDRPHGSVVLNGGYTVESGKAVATLLRAHTVAFDFSVLYYEVFSTALGRVVECGRLTVR